MTQQSNRGIIGREGTACCSNAVPTLTRCRCCDKRACLHGNRQSIRKLRTSYSVRNKPSPFIRITQNKMWLEQCVAVQCAFATVVITYTAPCRMPPGQCKSSWADRRAGRAVDGPLRPPMQPHGNWPAVCDVMLEY